MKKILILLILGMTFHPLFSILIADDDDRRRGKKWYRVFSDHYEEEDDHDEDDDDDDEYDNRRSSYTRYQLKPVDNRIYKKECGVCHLAYQPGLLPQKSWLMMFENMEDHYGKDVAPDEVDMEPILTYLVSNSAENSSARHSQKILSSLRGAAPVRISDVPYIKHEHDEIPGSVFNRKSVKSISYCKTCHTTADRGIFNERYIHIPSP